MKVKELTEILQKHDPDKKIMFIMMILEYIHLI